MDKSLVTFRDYILLIKIEHKIIFNFFWKKTDTHSDTDVKEKHMSFHDNQRRKIIFNF